MDKVSVARLWVRDTTAHCTRVHHIIVARTNLVSHILANLSSLIRVCHIKRVAQVARRRTMFNEVTAGNGELRSLDSLYTQVVLLSDFKN